MFTNLLTDYELENAYSNFKKLTLIFVTIKYWNVLFLFFFVCYLSILIQQLHTLNRVLCSKQYTDQVRREWERRSDRRDRQ